MPRNISGLYTLPPGNPVVEGTVIDVDWANPTMADIALQLNDVLTRDGVLGPTAPFRLVDGDAGAPGLSFASQPNLGLFRPGSGILGIASVGTEIARFSLSGSGVDFLLANPTDSAGQNASAVIRVGGASGGDPRLGFTVAGVTDWSIGIDNSDDDKFKISYSDALGTNDAVTVLVDGKVGVKTTAPSQRFQVGLPADTGSQYSRFAGDRHDIYIGQSAGGLFDLGANAAAYIFQDAAAAYPLAVGTLGASALVFGTGNIERARFTTTGTSTFFVGTTTSNLVDTARGMIVVGGESSSLFGLQIAGTDMGYLYHDALILRLINKQNGSIIFGTNDLECVTIDPTGNLIVAGNITAYSDERLKANWGRVVSSFVDCLAVLKSGTFERVDQALGTQRYVGVSAQSLQKFLPEAVLTDSEGTLSIAYGNAALVACVELAKRLIALEERVLG